MVTKVIGNKRNLHLYITEWREAQKLSIEQVAGRVEKARETVWRWENEQHRLNPAKIGLLAEALGIEPEQFYHLPSRPSLDALVKNSSDDTVNTAYDIVARLAKRA